MALDRHTERRGEGVSQMVARKQYNRAIEVLRARLAQSRPDPRTRLRLADLLVQAGRGQEAVPILLGLADDFGREGFVAKAVAVLKRVEKIRPNLADVNQRLDRLALQREPAHAATDSGGEQADGDAPEPCPPETDGLDPSAPNETVVLRIRGLLGRLLGGRADPVPARQGSPELTQPGPPPAPLPQSGPELDASAFLPQGFTPIPSASTAEAAAAAKATPVAPSEPAAPEAAADSAEIPPAAQPAEVETGPVPLANPATEDPAPSEATSDDAPAADEPGPDRGPEGGGFRSFLGRLWGRRRDETPQPDGEAAGAASRASEPAAETRVSEPVSKPAASAGAADDDVAATATAEAMVPIDPDPRPSAPPEPALREPALSEADFHERLLDVVQEALVRQSPEATNPVEASPSIDTSRLQQSPLLVELDDEELRQLVRDLQLRTCEPGDIVLTEGEPGETLFLLVGGTVKVFVRNPKSRNVEVRELGAGDFFGEVGFLSGRPRMATVVAASAVELLELERPALEKLALAHPGMLDMLEAYYLVRTQSDAAATLRSAAIDDPDVPRRAAEVLKAHFGEARWDPRMRLKLAEALIKSGKQQDALPILAGLADELVRAGYTEKAVAILKRIERIEGRHTEEISLAPLKRPATPAPPAPAPTDTPNPAPARPQAEGGFNGWLLELVRESVERGQTRSSPATTPGLLMSPLFEDFSEEELLALVRGLRLHECEAGDVVIGEGEDGNSVFVVTAGVVKVFVRNALGRNVLVGRLGEGDFFGEISLLSGRPRSATITAGGRCELLELDKPTLERVCAEHPRVRSVMEEVYIERASHPLAARVRASVEKTGAGQ